MTEVTSSDLIRDGLTASGHGDLDAVEAVLDPEVIVQHMDGQGDLDAADLDRSSRSRG
jgi:hypothetical protein